MNARRVVVVGAGPAGLAASLAAAERGARVVLLERGEESGRKLCAAGGGRGNVAPEAEPAALLAAFGPRGRFLSPALAAFGVAELRAWLGRLGEPLVVEDGRRWYPASQSARRVRDALVRETLRLGVELRTGERADALEPRAGRAAGVHTARGLVPADAVVVAAGGAAYPSLGGGGDGYALARQAGHPVVEPQPALVPLLSPEEWIPRAAGLSVPGVRLRLGRGRRAAHSGGDLLFTHRGLSGPAALDLSGAISEGLAGAGEATVSVAFRPDLDRAAWRRLLDAGRREEGSRPVERRLPAEWPARLRSVLCRAAGVDPATPCARLEASASARLCAFLAEAPVRVTATEGFARAMVTRGGVDLREVEPLTLRSRRVAGLHFAGEVLDIDGPSGGYNLLWAFSSGFLAGGASAAP